MEYQGFGVSRLWPWAGRNAQIIDIPMHYQGFGASRLAPGPAGSLMEETPGRPDLPKLGIPYELLGILQPPGLPRGRPRCQIIDIP